MLILCLYCCISKQKNRKTTLLIFIFPSPFHQPKGSSHPPCIWKPLIQLFRPDLLPLALYCWLLGSFSSFIRVDGSRKTHTDTWCLGLFWCFLVVEDFINYNAGYCYKKWYNRWSLPDIVFETNSYPIHIAMIQMVRRQERLPLFHPIFRSDVSLA